MHSTSPNSGPSIQCVGGVKANIIETQEENNDVMDINDTIVTAHSQDVTGTLRFTSSNNFENIVTAEKSTNHTSSLKYLPNYQIPL